MKKNTGTEKHLLTIAKNSGLGIGGRILFLFLRFLMTLLITRSMGPEMYGIFILAMSIATFVEAISLLGLESAMVKFMAQYIAENKMPMVRGVTSFGLKVSVIASLVLGAGFFFSADLISHLVFHKDSLAPVLRIMLLGVPFMSALAVLLSAMQGAKLLKYNILIQQILQPLSILLIIGVVLGLGYRTPLEIAWAWVIAPAAGVFIAALLLSKRIGAFFRNGAKINKREMFSFSLPLLFSQLLYQNIASFGVLIVGAFLSSGQLGVYGVAMRVIPFILIPLFSLNAIFAPVITDLFTKRKMDELEHIFKTGSKWVIIMSLPLFALTVSFSEDIASVFGRGFEGSARIMVIVLTGQLFNVCTGSTGIMLSMTGKAFCNLYNSIGLFVLNVVMTLLLVPRFGVVGAASAYAISMALIQVLQIAEVWHFYRMHPYRFDNLKPVASCLISAVLMSYLKNVFAPVAIWEIPIIGAAFLCCYAFFLLLSGLSSDDRLVLEKVRYKLFS